MEFEDIQVIWKSQDEEPAFGIDASALRTRLETNDIRVRRLFAFEEWMFISMPAVMGVIVISEPILEHHDYHQLPMGVGLFVLAIYFFILRVRRLKEEIDFGSSILGVVDSSIHHLRTYALWVKRANILFWAVLLIIIIVGFVMYYDSKPFWLWPSFLAFGAYAWFVVRRQLNNQHKSIKKLSILLEKLMDAEDSR